MIDEEILMAERNAALRTALAELPPRCQQLLSMLLRDPPCSYAEISEELSIPVGASARSEPAAWNGCASRARFAALGDGEAKIDIRGRRAKVRDDWDDERLLVAFGEAIKVGQAVP